MAEKNITPRINFRGRSNYVFFLASLAYALSIKTVLSNYAEPNWPIFSFPYAPPSLIGYVYLIATLALMTIFTPKFIDRPSNLMLIFIYLFIVVPLVTATICMDQLAPNSYYVLTSFTCLCFILTCTFNARFAKNYDPQVSLRTDGPALQWMLLYGFLVLAVYLIVKFGSVMDLVGLDSLYAQRAIGKASNLLDGYVQTYSQYVFSTGLVALGLYKKNYIFVALGIAGAIMNYAITAEKAGVLFPVFIIGLYLIISSKREIVKSTSFFMFGFAAVNFVSSYLYNVSYIFEIICINFGVRSTLVPGVFSLHYLDFFSERGFTYFSHIRGLDLIMPAPAQYVHDARWPVLGLILGEDYIGYNELNANANFVAYDGIASLGTVGIVVPFAVVFGIMRAFDHVTRGISLRLCLPLLAPIALTLSNSGAFSVLTSFGGFFWMLVFKFLFFPERRDRAVGSAWHSGRI